MPYTRVTEYRHLTGQVADVSTLHYEYPSAVGDPYYPVPRPENRALYNRYAALAAREQDVTFVGRLARYQYLNMDQVVAQALAAFAATLRPRSWSMPEPFVSALMAAYNAEPFVAEAIESALAQDWPADRLEVVVCDDGSTDGTAAVVVGVRRALPGARAADPPGERRPVRGGQHGAGGGARRVAGAARRRRRLAAPTSCACRARCCGRGRRSGSSTATCASSTPPARCCRSPGSRTSR